jgi:hypothetical protein
VSPCLMLTLVRLYTTLTLQAMSLSDEFVSRKRCRSLLIPDVKHILTIKY